MEVQLIDDLRHPKVRLGFSKNARTDTGALVRREVADLPSRHFDGKTARWVVRGFGVADHPSETLEDLGFDLDEADHQGLDELWYPHVEPHGAGRWMVYPRLAGFEAVRDELAGAGIWDREAQAFVVEAADLLDPEGLGRLSGVEIPEQLADEADAARELPQHFDAELSRDLTATVAPEAAVLDEAQRRVALPGQFGGGGVELFDFQYAAAYAVHFGRSLLSLPMGAGKSLTALAAAMLSAPQRIVVVVPPVAVTGFAAEAARSVAPVIEDAHPGLESPTKGKAGQFGAYVRAVYAGRKVPQFPEVGVVVVPDSMLTKPDIREAIDQWGADFLIVDEAHRFRTWDSKRSVAVRGLAQSFLVGRRVAVTGTPMLNHPGEMANLLAITGQLHTVFGSYADYLAEYTRTDKWGKVHAKKKRLPQLGRVLDEQVWVFHDKADILPHLPGKHRTFLAVDVDLADYRAAHFEVVETLIERHDGAEEFAALSGSEVEDLGQAADISLISPMRRASGVAKVETSVDMVRQMVVDEDSPVVVFCHHRDVVDAVTAALSEDRGLTVARLDGSVSSAKRGQVEQDFQAGGVDVLVASIAAAGVAITLTASHRMLFVESDWTPGNNVQAEDRCDRVGQELPVEVTSLIAAGTVDEHLHAVLSSKIGDLEALTGSAVHGQAATAEMQIREVLTGVHHAAHAEATRRVKRKA